MASWCGGFPCEGQLKSCENNKPEKELTKPVFEKDTPFLFTRQPCRQKTWPLQLQSLMETKANFSLIMSSLLCKYLNQGPEISYQRSCWRSKGLVQVSIVKLIQKELWDTVNVPVGASKGKQSGESGDEWAVGTPVSHFYICIRALQ